MSTFLPFSLPSPSPSPSPSCLLKLPNCREKGAEGRGQGPLCQTVERLDYNGSINNVCSEFYSKGVFLGTLIV